MPKYLCWKCEVVRLPSPPGSVTTSRTIGHAIQVTPGSKAAHGFEIPNASVTVDPFDLHLPLLSGFDARKLTASENLPRTQRFSGLTSAVGNHAFSNAFDQILGSLGALEVVGPDVSDRHR
jgi:hypothetical protein